MRYYHRLGQPFTMDGVELSEYFDRLNIKYRIGADFENLSTVQLANGYFLKTYVVLVDQEDLLAIELSNPDVKVMECVGLYKFYNFIRKQLSRFVK